MSKLLPKTKKEDKEPQNTSKIFLSLHKNLGEDILWRDMSLNPHWPISEKKICKVN